MPVKVVDQSTRDYLADLGLERSLEKYNGELQRLYDLVANNPDLLEKLRDRITKIEVRRDKLFKLIREIRREVDPGSIISSVNPGYH
mgnify:CR=1 FL=1